MFLDFLVLMYHLQHGRSLLVSTRTFFLSHFTQFKTYNLSQDYNLTMSLARALLGLSPSLCASPQE